MQDALSARLGIIKPTKAGMEQLIANHEFKLSSGVKELVQTLKDRQVDVYLVSGGFRRMILPVARILEIDEKNVFANRLLFCDEDGSFQGIDHNEPTSRAGGKAEVANILRRKFNYKCMVFIGDGATDLEAKQNVELFIGYGGVQIRPKVKELSDWFIEDFADMINVLKS